MHEQSLCSGTYYSNAPPDSVPLILSDPRGGQPMHTDMGKPEGEPEGPFFHQVSFFLTLTLTLTLTLILPPGELLPEGG